MQPFASLTPIGQTRRLRDVAHAALQHYAITVRRLSLLTVDTNTNLRVDAADGELCRADGGCPGGRRRADL